MNARYADWGTLSNCCGVYEIGDFHFTSGGWGGSPIEHAPRDTGANLVVATFTERDGQKEAYEALCRRYRLLYQSPIKRNRNSGNNLFLCVFDSSSRGR